MKLLWMLLLLRAGEPAAPAGYPCNPCSSEQIRELGIVAPPPKVRPACDAYDNDKTDVARWINRPANCAD